MAIYQYHLTVIPRHTLHRHWNPIPDKVQYRDNPKFGDDLINVNWWDKLNTDFDDIEKRISAFADQVEWTKTTEGMKTFGNNDTNDITISKTELGQLEGISFRIDLREIDKSFIDNVLKISKDLDCLLLDSQENLFEPTHENLADNVKKSNAFKYVTNPTDFLNKLGKEIEME
jgi:hypothetical protein